MVGRLPHLNFSEVQTVGARKGSQLIGEFSGKW